MKTNTFKLGDLVQWTSQSAGSSKTKIGRVMGIVPPDRGDVQTSKGRLTNDQFFAWIQKRRNGDLLRNRKHKSYVVLVEQPGNRCSKLYHPRVSALELVRNNSNLAAIREHMRERLEREAIHQIRVFDDDENQTKIVGHVRLVFNLVDKSAIVDGTYWIARVRVLDSLKALVKHIVRDCTYDFGTKKWIHDSQVPVPSARMRRRSLRLDMAFVSSEIVQDTTLNSDRIVDYFQVRMKIGIVELEPMRLIGDADDANS